MSSNPTLVKLVENILKRSGLLDIRTTVIDDIEEEIAGAYDSIDDEEDDAITPSYGGIVYSSYYYLTESEFEHRVDKKLTDAQKEFTHKCSRRPNIDPGCRLNIDPGLVAVF